MPSTANNKPRGARQSERLARQPPSSFNLEQSYTSDDDDSPPPQKKSPTGSKSKYEDVINTPIGERGRRKSTRISTVLPRSSNPSNEDDSAKSNSRKATSATTRRASVSSAVSARNLRSNNARMSKTTKDNGDEDDSASDTDESMGSDSDTSEDESEDDVDEDVSESESSSSEADKSEYVASRTEMGDPLRLKLTKQTATLPVPQMTPKFAVESLEPTNTEAYFLASTRIKFRPEKSTGGTVANDCRKGKRVSKKPRKGTRGAGGQKLETLPERVRSNFSVTKEAIRAFSEGVRLNEDKHSEQVQYLLENKFVPDFPRWLFLMREGFNVILHGVGSKMYVFQAFKSYLNGEWLVITINGLFQKINPRKFLTEFCESLGLKENVRISGTNIDVLSVEVYNQLRSIEHDDVFLLIRNFDSLAINHPNLLTLLCSLVQIEWIHILASTDHVNACLGVNQYQSIQLNLCWVECSTFQPYNEEFIFVPGIYGDSKNSQAGGNTLQYVLKSLTGNARTAFSILASLQLEKMQAYRGKKGKEFNGVEFGELARLCKQRFIAHTDAALRTLLVEFVDHKLIIQGKNKSAGSLLTIDLDKDDLEKLVRERL